MEDTHQSIEEEVMAAMEGVPETQQEEGSGFLCVISNVLECIFWALLE